MTIDRDRIDALRDRYDACFGCGKANAIGLHLDDFALADGWVTASFTPREEYAGFADTLHGGVVATALDEGSAWAAMVTEDVLVFTARLEVRFRSQARTSSSFTVRSRVEDRSGRRIRIRAELRDGDRTVAESSGVFVVAVDHTAALDA